MKVLVCGSRTYTDQASVSAALFGWTALTGDDPDFIIIEGGARGADRFARKWAIDFRREYETYNADWQRYGKAAGHIRNGKMLWEGRPDIVLAFVDKPLAESKGTANMVAQAEALGVQVYVTERRPAYDTEGVVCNYDYPVGQ